MLPGVREMARPKARLWLPSTVVGSVFSCVLSLFGYWCPLFWPGFFVTAAIVAVGHGEHWDSRVLVALATLGNAALYTWVALRVLKADVAADGRIGRPFTR